MEREPHVTDRSSLAEEIAYFEEHRQEWLKTYPDLFVLVMGRELVGAFSTFEEAYNVGVERFGNVPMLIKQVRESEPIERSPALMLGLIRARA